MSEVPLYRGLSHAHCVLRVQGYLAHKKLTTAVGPFSGTMSRLLWQS